MGVQRGGVDETRSETLLRRLRSIPPLVLGLLLTTALLPALLVVGLAIDLGRWAVSRVPPTATRLALFLWIYLAAEVAGLAALAAAWVASLGGRRDAWLRRATLRLQQLWAAALFGAVRALFGLRLEVTGGDGAPAADVLVVAHHGFDGLRLVSDIWRGGLVGLTVRVHITRVPRSAVPRAGPARTDWIYDLWQDVDDWVERQRHADDLAGAAT